jgi:hypothetical protein
MSTLFKTIWMQQAKTGSPITFKYGTVPVIYSKSRFANPGPYHLGKPVSNPHHSEKLGPDPDLHQNKKARSCCGFKWSHGGL